MKIVGVSEEFPFLGVRGAMQNSRSIREVKRFMKKPPEHWRRRPKLSDFGIQIIPVITKAD